MHVWPTIGLHKVYDFLYCYWRIIYYTLFTQNGLIAYVFKAFCNINVYVVSGVSERRIQVAIYQFEIVGLIKKAITHTRTHACMVNNTGVWISISSLNLCLETWWINCGGATPLCEGVCACGGVYGVVKVRCGRCSVSGWNFRQRSYYMFTHVIVLTLLIFFQIKVSINLYADIIKKLNWRLPAGDWLTSSHVILQCILADISTGSTASVSSYWKTEAVVMP